MWLRLELFPSEPPRLMGPHIGALVGPQLPFGASCVHQPPAPWSPHPTGYRARASVGHPSRPPAPQLRLSVPPPCALALREALVWQIPSSMKCLPESAGTHQSPGLHTRAHRYTPGSAGTHQSPQLHTRPGRPRCATTAHSGTTRSLHSWQWKASSTRRPVRS